MFQEVMPAMGRFSWGRSHKSRKSCKSRKSHKSHKSRKHKKRCGC